MRIVEIEELETFRKDMPDDLFITCVSFEERCTKSLLHSENYKAKNIIVFNYHESKKEIARRKANRKTILQNAKTRVKDEKNIFLIECSRSNPREGYYKFLELCRMLGFSTVSRKLAITIDISVFTKSYLLVLFKAFESLGKNRISAIYTEPAFYYPERLTLGVKSIGYVPFYNGNPTPLKPNLLFIFCGFEGERAYAIWEYVEPQKTIAFIGKPGYQPTYPLIARELNRNLINGLEKVEKGVSKVIEVSPRDPAEVCSKLEFLWRENQNYNILIAPLGTKLQALGIYLFTLKNPSAHAQVICATPQRYFENYYARGSNKMFQYELELERKQEK